MSISQDLSVQVFLNLRELFFDPVGSSYFFKLRDKGGTQDDPLDEYIAHSLKEIAPDIECLKASSLTTPDLVLLRPALCQGETQEVLRFASDRIIGIEVKKLEVTKKGNIARATGLDYNSTPPSATVRVFDKLKKPLDIRGYYLFVSVELDKISSTEKQIQITSLALCDGALLNDCFQFYLDTTKPRSMERKKGSYGDGGIRLRPMAVFPNPLSFKDLYHNTTLIHTNPNLVEEYTQLKRIITIERKGIDGNLRKFFAYRLASDVPPDAVEKTVQDPFAKARKEKQGMRGKLRLKNISIVTEAPPEEDTDLVSSEPIK